MIFITGATGFIGRHLTQRLKDYVPYTGDVLDKEELIKQMKGCKAVIHLAGKFNGPDSNPIYSTNVIGTANVVQAMHENKIKKLIFVSSVGANDRFKNAYDDSKFIAEKVVDDLRLNTVILRLSNLYGKDQKDKLITSLINGFKKGEVTVTGDGKQTRDFVHVDDVVEAIVRALKVKRSVVPIDIGCGISYSVLQVIKMISKVSGKKVKIKFVDFPKYAKNIKSSKVNLLWAESVLNWRPTIGLEEGLKQWKF